MICPGGIIVISPLFQPGRKQAALDLCMTTHIHTDTEGVSYIFELDFATVSTRKHKL